MTQITLRRSALAPVLDAAREALRVAGAGTAAFGAAMRAASEAERLCHTSDAALAARGETREGALRALFERHFG